jgi:hypothetical protein
MSRSSAPSCCRAMRLFGRWNWWLPEWVARLVRVQRSNPFWRSSRTTTGTSIPCSLIEPASALRCSGVERAHVHGNADLDERDVAPGLLCGTAHQALPWLWPAPLAGRSPATRTPVRACHPWAGRPVSGRSRQSARRLLPCLRRSRTCWVADTVVPDGRGRELSVNADNCVSSGAVVGGAVSRRSLLTARRRLRRPARVPDDGSLGPSSCGGPRSCTRPGPQPPPRPLGRPTPAGCPNREAGASYAVTNGVIAVPDRRPGLT